MRILRTKYLKPNGFKGARVKAYTDHMSITLPWDYELNDGPMHYKAVMALGAKYKLDWDLSAMSYGYDEVGYFFTFKDARVPASWVQS